MGGGGPFSFGQILGGGHYLGGGIIKQHGVDFEISREKSDFLKVTISHLGLNRGSIFFFI